jgi:hypothetical protein
MPRAAFKESHELQWPDDEHEDECQGYPTRDERRDPIGRAPEPPRQGQGEHDAPDTGPERGRDYLADAERLGWCHVERRNRHDTGGVQYPEHDLVEDRHGEHTGHEGLAQPDGPATMPCAKLRPTGRCSFSFLLLFVDGQWPSSLDAPTRPTASPRGWRAAGGNRTR